MAKPEGLTATGNDARSQNVIARRPLSPLVYPKTPIQCEELSGTSDSSSPANRLNSSHPKSSRLAPSLVAEYTTSMRP